MVEFFTDQWHILCSGLCLHYYISISFISERTLLFYFPSWMSNVALPPTTTHTKIHLSFLGVPQGLRGSPPPPPAALATVFSNSSQLNSQTYEKRNSNNSSLRCCGLLSLYLQTRRSHVGYWQLSSGAEYFSLARSRTAAC